MFLVDGSGSIENQGIGNFQRSKDFITSLVDTFNVGRDQVNVATVLYWHSYRIIHRFNTYYSKDSIVRAIQEMPYPSGGTRTGQGLNVVRNLILSNLEVARDQLPKVVVVLTDGLSQDNVASPAQALHNMGVTVIAVGVGCCFYRPELNAMASDPDQDHVYEVSFTDLQQITASLREQICVGKEILLALKACVCFSLHQTEQTQMSTLPYISFPIRTAQSQYPNVCLTRQRNANRCYWLRTTCFIFESFEFCSQQFH